VGDSARTIDVPWARALKSGQRKLLHIRSNKMKIKNPFLVTLIIFMISSIAWGAPTEPHFHWRDLSEVAIGACIMAFPFATRNEIWKLGAELSVGRILVFAAASIFLLSLVVYVIHSHDELPLTHTAFVIRVLSTYAVAFFISAILLLCLDRFDLFEKPLTSIKTTVLVAFPACFAATAVDSFLNRS
jgi:uncharacterized membrane protein